MVAAVIAASALTIALVPAPAVDASGPLGEEAPPAQWHASGRLPSVAPHAFPSSSPTDFGASVAVDEGILVVGAPYEEAGYVYARVWGAWMQADVLEGPEGFGESLAVDGSTIAVGAPSNSSVLVFEEGESGWALTSTLTVAGTDCLGSSIALQDDLLATGDPCGSRTVHLFEAGSGGWTHVGELSPEADDRFGRSVDISGTTVLVGGNAAHAFHRTPDGGWSGPTLVSAAAGLKVALSGDLAATGAIGEARVYERAAGSWSPAGTVTPADLSVVSPSGNRFSFTLDLAGETLVVGASRDDPSPGVADVPGVAPSECTTLVVTGVCASQEPGAAYVYERSSTGWDQVAKLAPEIASGEDFARSVAIDDQAATIVAGSPGHARGLSGFVDIQDSVYTFDRRPTGVAS